MRAQVCPLSSRVRPASGRETYLADARQHVDRRSKVPNVEYRQRELDVPVMPDAARRLFATRQTRLALFARPQPAVQRSILCRRLGPILVDLVQVLHGHLRLGDPDNVFGLERLELDVFADA